MRLSRNKLCTASKLGKRGEKSKGKKSWWLFSRQLFHIMGDAHQTPLGFHLLQAPQVESAEAHIVFDDAKDRFHFDGTGRPQALSCFTGQVGSGLAAIFEQAQADADLTVSLCPGTFGSERTLAAGMTLVDAPMGDIAIVGSIAGSILILQSLVGWADELVLLLVIGEVLCQELAFA